MTRVFLWNLRNVFLKNLQNILGRLNDPEISCNDVCDYHKLVIRLDNIFKHIDFVIYGLLSLETKLIEEYTCFLSSCALNDPRNI